VARIERSIDIDAPPEKVFGELAHWGRLTQWSTITADHDGPERCTGVGEEFDQHLRLAGINVQTHWRVTEYEPPRMLAYEATGPGDSWLRMRQEVVAVDAGSRVQLQVDYELPAGVLGEAVDRMYVERRNQREAEHSLENLKELIEAGAG
jgi:uncharacterized protein YndB with AHSA1/START domain